MWSVFPYRLPTHPSSKNQPPEEGSSTPNANDTFQPDSPPANMSVLVDRVLPLQQWAGIASMIISTAAFALSLYWASQHNDGGVQGWLGGYNSCTLHAIFLILAMCMSMTWSLMSYRVFKAFGHEKSKGIHAIFHIVTLAFLITGLVEIVKWHNETSYWGHLNSFHSWLGCLTVALFGQNYVFGFVAYGIPNLVSVQFKRKTLPLHRFFGVLVFLIAAVTMETGIMQKAWIDGGGCFYSLNQYDDTKKNPAKGWVDIPLGCRVGYGVGLLIILNVIVALFALWDFQYDVLPQGEGGIEAGK